MTEIAITTKTAAEVMKRIKQQTINRNEDIARLADVLAKEYGTYKEAFERIADGIDKDWHTIRNIYYKIKGA